MKKNLLAFACVSLSFVAASAAHAEIKKIVCSHGTTEYRVYFNTEPVDPENGYGDIYGGGNGKGQLFMDSSMNHRSVFAISGWGDDTDRFELAVNEVEGLFSDGSNVRTGTATLLEKNDQRHPEKTETALHCRRAD